MTLTEFLLARIADDEAEVLSQECGCDLSYDGTHHPSCVVFVLAEREAKRRCIEIHSPGRYSNGTFMYGCFRCITGPDPEPCETVKTLALPYADHPDYRDEWKP